jgi:hypothetical protein
MPISVRPSAVVRMVGWYSLAITALGSRMFDSR